MQLLIFICRHFSKFLTIIQFGAMYNTTNVAYLLLYFDIAGDNFSSLLLINVQVQRKRIRTVVQYSYFKLKN